MVKHVIALVISFTVIPGVTFAQQSPFPGVPHLQGSTVRVQLADGRILQGKAEQVSRDAIVINGASCKTADVRTLEVADGVRDGAARGFAVGALIGSLIGVGAAQLAGLGSGDAHEIRGLVVGGIGVGAIGALFGAGIDAAHPHYRAAVVVNGGRLVFAPVLTVRSAGVRGSIRW